MVGYKRVGISYNHAHACGVVAVYYVFFGKHMGRRNDYSAQLVQRGIGNPVFGAPLKYDHNKIALFYT